MLVLVELGELLVHAYLLLTSTSQLEGPDMTRKAKSELFSALFKLHHLANCMYHRLEENEAKRSSLLPFGGDQI